jgi:putative ABC transport system permease protein
MKIWQLVLKEILHRKTNFSLSVLAALVAAASLIGAIVLLRLYDIRTSTLLRAKEVELQARMDKLQDETRKSMLKLGFNLVILPKEQNLADWHSQDYSDLYMPESYADALAGSKIVSVRHILPSLQQKTRWPEKNRTVILMGTRGEVPNQHLSPQKPLIQPVPPGTIILGYELHRSMNIKPDDRIRFMGRDFKVKACYSERGNKDDITIWIDLKAAQELLGKAGKINAILALECLCTGDSLPAIRKEVAEILPGTQVIEREPSVIARAEARTQVALEATTTLEKERRGRENLREERERMASVLVPVILLACALWVGVMGFINVRSRREEVGILRAMGVTSGNVFMLFMWKHIAIGVLGGCLGMLLGILIGSSFAGPGPTIPFASVGSVSFWIGLAALSIVGSAFMTVIAGWIPAVIASNQDPAEALREE